METQGLKGMILFIVPFATVKRFGVSIFIRACHLLSETEKDEKSWKYSICRWRFFPNLCDVISVPKFI